MAASSEGNRLRPAPFMSGRRLYAICALISRPRAGRQLRNLVNGVS